MSEPSAPFDVPALREHEFQSKVPIVGPLIVTVRRTLYSLTAKWPLRVALDQQTHINRQLVQQLFEHETRLHSSEARLHECESQLQEYAARLHECETQLQEYAARLRERETQLQEYAARLHEYDERLIDQDRDLAHYSRVLAEIELRQRQRSKPAASP